MRVQLALLLATQLSAPACLSADRQAAQLASPCLVCHTLEFNSPNPIPTLAGMSAADINQALLAYRRGQAGDTIMGRHARGYSEQELGLIAAYLATLTDNKP